METARISRYLIYLGPLVVVLAWLIIGAAWLLNRDWFVFTRHAFSDLGGPRSCCPGLYNYGLVLLGVLLALWGIAATYLAENKPEAIGASYMVVAGVFLLLIGIFPSGTRHHVCVSTWFFIQSYWGLSLLLYGQAKRGSRAAKVSLAALLVSIPLGVLLALWPGWPSAATLETYLIVFIDVGVIVASRELSHR
ncbi:DUF998 domain-containing protein [Pyrofollis japonicus]|uniref:DUF998 domain-containing protein n=1 Tax=Pyrofollis japonicus TaxID=3060460 RepID=UPI00295AAF99|nr:DUF998 domain-containing protein [Pyrofollis japonicus]BEP17826.1 DUF998 domain-containing protein [Pyrofollis japonicus]